MAGPWKASLLRPGALYDEARDPTHPIDFSSVVASESPLLFTGMTIPANSNIIRGTDLTPKRASGWTAFTGTVTTTPTQVYSDYRELHSGGVAEVLGMGQFVFMDSGANCASLFGGQFIAEVDPGATVAASSGPGVGVFGLFVKTLINNPTAFHASGVASSLWLSFQSNVLDISSLDTSLINMEIASGGIRSVFKLGVTAAAGATYLLDFTDDIAPIIDDPTLYTDPNAATCEKGISVRIGSTLYMIPLYVHD